MAGLEIRPVTPDRWDDLVTLFGPRGAVAGCWCMWWRLSAKEWESKAYEGNRRSMRSIVAAGERPGLLAYRDDVPVGWVSVAPREQFQRIERSRVLGPVDDAEVWSVVCFYIHRKERGSGVGSALLDAAVAEAGERGATIVEGYPVDPRGGKTSNGSAFTGLESMFRAAGFEEVERRSAGRPIMRKRVARRRKTASRR
ncbi:MAG: GNAT family N-acetyltransferase [Actinomycetota bacterium]